MSRSASQVLVQAREQAPKLERTLGPYMKASHAGLRAMSVEAINPKGFLGLPDELVP